MNTLPRLYFLRIDNDYLEDAKAFQTKQGAVRRFLIVARELDRYGQACTATVHVARSKDELVEYPDWVLSLGPRGGARIEKA